MISREAFVSRRSHREDPDKKGQALRLDRSARDATPHINTKQTREQLALPPFFIRAAKGDPQSCMNTTWMGVRPVTEYAPADP